MDCPFPGMVHISGVHPTGSILNEVVLAVYFPLCFLLLLWQTGKAFWEPLALCGAVAAARVGVKKLNLRLSLALLSTVVVLWCGWYVGNFGWGGGVQLFLMTLLVLVYFNIFEPPQAKLMYTAALLLCRLGLYVYSLRQPPLYELGREGAGLFQALNSTAMFVSLSLSCILFSTNIQDAERQLRIVNQQLSREADTDPLTQLPNRRAMRDTIEIYLSEHGSEGFSVAIADIDFFKKVNDTYGHQCGDYTLKRLAELFRENAAKGYSVCRWGGEEFCFFLPGMNLDQAGQVMYDLCVATRRMPLSFEGTNFNITITVGVEEHDFASEVDAILQKADQKLYLGKNSGRNQVVI